MNQSKSSRLTAAIVTATTLILAAGSAAVASNMGFKLNRALVLRAAGQSGLKGANPVSIPANNPYGNMLGLCQQLGLVLFPTTGFANVTRLNPVSGTYVTNNCGSNTNNIALVPGEGLQIVQPVAATAPASVIIVGSHNPTLVYTAPPTGAGNIGNYWFSVPYHTTAVTVQDLCNQAGFTNFPTANFGVVTQIDSTTGSYLPSNCGTSTAASRTLKLGDFVQVRQPPGGKSFIPAHF